MTIRLLKKLTIGLATLTIATPAFAASTFSEAVAITDGTVRAVDQTDFIRLSSDLDMSKAAEIDAAFTQNYGAPVTQRNGVKVWEVKNKGAGNDMAKTVTIMCGVEDGKVQITVDARKPDIAPPKSQQVRKPLKAKAKTAKPVRAKAAPSANRESGRLELRPGNSDR